MASESAGGDDDTGERSHGLTISSAPAATTAIAAMASVHLIRGDRARGQAMDLRVAAAAPRSMMTR